MVLRTNFKAFKVVSSEKKFFQKLEIFWLFLHIQCHRFLKKWLTTFSRNSGLKFAVDCTNGVANKFLGVLGCFKRKNSFLKVASFFTFFAYPGSQISWKRTNYLFERYRPEICRVANIHKWCCERILRRFRLFRVKKNFFQKFEIFWLFLHIRGHRFLEKWLTTFLWDTDLKFVVDCTNGVANEFLGVLGCFKRKNSFLKVASFFTFFAYPGSQISWKRTNYLFERYRPEICRVANIHKWCCERILRRFRLFRVKKNFFQIFEIFWLFLHIRGHRFLEKWLTTFLRDTDLKFVVDCTNGVANEF